MVNSPFYQSEIGNVAVLKKDEDGKYICDCAIVWSYDPHRVSGCFSCSARSRNENDQHFDVAKFVKQWGGGGHACAAGFAINDIEVFIDLFNDYLWG